MQLTPSLVYGPNEPELWQKTLGALIDGHATRHGDRPAVTVPWQSTQLSYSQLADRSRILAKAMLGMGLQHGDCVGIMAGNCYQYIEIFLGGARIGCPVVVLNNTYTPQELESAVLRSSCKLVFMSPMIGARSFAGHVQTLRGQQDPNPTVPELRRIVLLGDLVREDNGIEIQDYETFKSASQSIVINDIVLKKAENKVYPEDVLNLQFTSGTTGAPKAAMLTHTGLINNARFVGRAMNLTADDVMCCPPPLFHCFGLVMGFLASFTHGSNIVFPAEYFDVKKVVESMIREEATVILGVPTMYIAEMEVMAKTGQRPRRLRTGLASGATVSQDLMDRVREQMGVDKMLIAYGMTETSPITFINGLDDPDEKRTCTVGRAMPHTRAKVIDKNGNVLPRGERGELCTSGYALQKGYWKNRAKTKEVMKMDDNGLRWMHTGDEAMIDSDGYVHITGRIKDMIIRGGENIFPREVEERLMAHPAINEASVVAIKDEKYGEVVGGFLKAANGVTKPTDTELVEFVCGTLGRHKAPRYIFWIGDPGVGSDFPKTGSGKHQKHILRDIGNRLVEGSRALTLV
ncbi:hypothetical protein BBP40_005625 [Aspergillus hancockii]|nr:hypothetical protein BBP40_005625 [Aspergillus hancockii]